MVPSVAMFVADGIFIGATVGNLPSFFKFMYNMIAIVTGYSKSSSAV